MKLTMLDWSIVVSVLVVILVVGAWVSKRASKNSASFFLGNRQMPWWLLGTSMVATTFSTDTPNLVTNLVRTGGVSSNWVWWCFLLTGMLTAFVYAKMWRRIGVSTDIEFYERRYSGRPATFLRGFRAIYLGVFFNVMIMSMVTLAAIKFGGVLMNLSPIEVVLGAGLVTVTFSALGGFIGVLITDVLLFTISMAGAFIAAYYAVNLPEVGGLTGLFGHASVQGKMAMMPDFSDPNEYVPLLLVPLAVQWWAAWYPGAEPGGGGYVAQRMLAAKNERHAVAATVFFNFAHYAIRPWPWILVALASLIIFPDLASMRSALPHVDASIIKDDLAYPAMLTFLPTGLLGLVAASLVAAYISTMSTSLNWGASYLVNDVYVRFVNKDSSPKQQIMVGRLSTIVLMTLSGMMALALESAMQAFQLMLTIGAGTGLLFILRWFWHRINAWSEISAMILSFVVSLGFEFYGPDGMEGWHKFVIGVGVTTIGWLVVTFLTAPTSKEKLKEFTGSLGGEDSKIELKKGIIAMLWSSAGVYGLLFGTGYLLYGQMMNAAVCLVIACVATVLTIRNIKAVKISV